MAQSTELISFLPYLLQDFWELGSEPDVMIGMMNRHIPVSPDTRVLDLACGKGAVSVKLAKALGVQVKGVDILPEFIDYARQKAGEYSVQDLCRFEVEDIGEAVQRERDYGCVILGAVGDVLGEPFKTLEQLKQTIKPGGIILLDDSYSSEGGEMRYYNYEYLTYQGWLDAIARAGLELLEKLDSNYDSDFGDDMRNIEARAAELAGRHPEKRQLFEDYVRSQYGEYSDLNNSITGMTITLRKRHDAGIIF